MKLRYFILSVFGTLLCTSFQSGTGQSVSKYKCMVQLANYTGEGAYIVVSAIDQQGEYLSTLRVLGDDEEWYPDLTDWWDFHTGAQKPAIDGITGATIAGGERSVFVLEVPDSLVDAGNQLRFETAVEDQRYVIDDVLLDLTATNLAGKFEGSGYIRYVRMIPSN